MPPNPIIYLFAYFTGNGAGGLHLATSSDAIRWTAFNGGAPMLTPVLGEHRLMRDPHLSRGPNGIFHLLWTTGWNDPFIGHASSTDLVNWSEQRVLPVMDAHPGTRNCWAPEAAYDPATGDFIIIWSSTVPGRNADTDNLCEDGYNHRLYATRTRDFKTLSPTALFYDPGFPVIDGTLLRRRGQWHLFFKDETVRPVARKTIHHVSAPTLAGPWTAPSPPIGSAWAEGPAALDLGSETLLIFDLYNREKYAALRSSDLSTWRDPAPDFTLPTGARHGSLLAVPASLLSS